MTLIKAQGGTCPPDLLARATETYKDLNGRLDGYNDKLKELQKRKSTPEIKKEIKATTAAINSLNNDLDRIRPFIATEVEAATGKEFAGGSSSRVIKEGLEGEGGQQEETDVPQVTKLVKMGLDKDGNQQVVPVVLNTHDKGGNPIAPKVLDAEARKTAQDRVRFAAEIGITQVPPEGTTEESPQGTLDLGPRSSPRPAEPMITPAKAKPEAKPEAKPVEKEKRAVEVRYNMHNLPKHSRWIGPGDKRNWRQGLSKINKEGEREDAPEEDKPSWALDPNGYRFRVNQFYRENKVPLSLVETAKKTMNHIHGQISEARRAKDSEKVASLTNKKERVREKLLKDLNTLKGRLKPKALEAEHKKLIEAVIKETQGGGPEARDKRSLLDKEALKAYGLELPKAKDISSEQISFLQEKSPESREDVFDALRNAGMSEEDVDKLKEDLSARLPTTKNIVEDHYGKFKPAPAPKGVKDLETLSELRTVREPSSTGFADTEKAARDKIRKELKKDMELKPGTPEFERAFENELSVWKEWKAKGGISGHARGYTSPQDANKEQLKKWIRKINNGLIKHRNALLDAHDVPVSPGALDKLTKDQRDLVQHVAAAEKEVKKRLIRALRGDAPKGRKETPADVPVAKFAAGTTTGTSYPAESAGVKDLLGKLGSGISTPVFDALDVEGQQEIIELLKKSVNTEEPLPTDTLMPGLFLNIALFKALTVSEEQKIQAFKNSFGAGTSGVGPATMNTVGIGERDKDKDEDDDDKTKKSLNLGFYIRC